MDEQAQIQSTHRRGITGKRGGGADFHWHGDVGKWCYTAVRPTAASAASTAKPGNVLERGMGGGGGGGGAGADRTKGKGKKGQSGYGYLGRSAMK